MGDLHAFFDRDVFIKLAVCDLWHETLTAFGVTHPYRLASATSKGAATPLRRWGIDDGIRERTLERLRIMAAQVPVVPEQWLSAAMTTDTFNAMNGTDNIDAGEAGLAAVALYCEHENRLVTGDKRFLTRMRTAFPSEFAKLQPRLISFEHCLLAVCETSGFDAIRDRLIAVRACDGTLSIAFGSGSQTTAASFCAALHSYDPLQT